MSSTSSPPSVTVSRTTRARTPAAVSTVRRVTVTTTRCRVPSGAVSRETHRVPGRIGHHGLVIVVVNSAGSRTTGSAPCGSPPPVPAATTAPAPSAIATPAPTSKPVVVPIMRLPVPPGHPGRPPFYDGRDERTVSGVLIVLSPTLP